MLRPDWDNRPTLRAVDKLWKSRVIGSAMKVKNI